MKGSVILLDQILKKYVEENLSTGETKPLLGEIIELRKHHNKGFVLNKCSNNKEFVKILHAISFGAVLCYSTIAYLKRSNKIRKIGLSLVLGGGLSNLYDRISKGYVVDYLGIKKGKEKIQNITFNLADVLIFAGALLSLCPGKARKSGKLLK